MAQEQSLYYDWVKKYFAPLAIQKSKDIIESGQYLFRQMLGRKYSIDGSWVALSDLFKNVAADVVSMDSRLDVKSRPSLKSASGEIPKIGMKLKLTEKQMKVIDTLIASNQNGVYNNEIIRELFADLARCEKGVYERLEYLFLNGLSNGVVLTDNENDASIGVRLNYGFYNDHKFGVSFEWSNADTSKPITDIDNVIAKAQSDGYVLSVMMLRTEQINQIRRSKEAIAAYASYQGTTSAGADVPKTKLLEWFADEKGLTVVEVKRTVTVEKDGAQTVINPWKEGMIVFLNSMNVGDLVWTRLAEMNHPAKQVTYQAVDDFILLSKYHQVDPIEEHTSSQAMAVPVISNVGGIYQLDTTTVQA